MSVDPSRLIDRIAKVVGLLNKPSLNNTLVVVENFDPTNYRYGCKNLYISSGSPDSLSLRRHNLEFISPIFEIRYSNAPTVSGYDFHCAPAGTILDFSQCNSEPCSDIPLIFDKAFSVRGSKRTLTRPMTVVRHLVIVAIECDEVIEFEDINFDIANGAVILKVGCHVHSRDSSLVLKHSMILSCADCGVFISTGGKGIVDNCQFQGDKGVIGGGDIRNHGGINSTVIRDGAVMPRDGLMMNIGRFFGVGGRTLVSEKYLDDVSPLVVARVRKRAGMGVVTCEACGAEEPTETEFRKCAVCKSCCYCSKDCQKSHWKEHRRFCN
eukprot:gene9239-10895_t